MRLRYKIFFLLLFVFISTFFLSISSYSAEKFELYVDNRYIGRINFYLSDDGRALLPVRDLFRLLGGSVGWIGSTKETYIQLAGKRITIKIGSREYKINGSKGILDVPLSVIDGKLVVSCSLLNKVWGYTCKIDKNRKRIDIDTALPVLENFYYKRGKNSIEFVLKFSKYPEFKMGVLTSPPRIFIDLYNTSSRVVFDNMAVNSDIVKGIRSGRFSSYILRIVFDLRVDANYTVNRKGNNIILSFFSKEQKDVPIINPTPTETFTKPLVEWTPSSHKKKIIILDPGHGGKDPGAIGRYGTREKDIVLSVALRLKSILEKSGFVVYMTRYSDTFIPLQERPKFANRKDGDLFISLHVNSAPRNTKASGIETFYLSSRYSDPSAKEVAKRENASSFTGKPLSEEEIIKLILSDLLLTVNIEDSSKFAGIVEKQLAAYTEFPIRGVKTAPFIVLKGLKMPAVLVEMGFISNPKEESLLKKRDFQLKLAKGITSAVKIFFRGH